MNGIKASFESALGAKTGDVVLIAVGALVVILLLEYFEAAASGEAEAEIANLQGVLNSLNPFGSS